MRGGLRITVAAWLCLAIGMIGAATSRADEPDRFRGTIQPITASKHYKFGVTLVHLHDDFWKGIAYGIVEEAKRSGVDVVQVTVAGNYGNVREQFAQLQTLKTLGVDVAVLGAAAYNGYDPVVKELSDAKIKVVAAGIPVNSAHIDFGVTQDDGAIGQVLADAICKADPKAKAVMIPGPAGAEWVRLRYVGFVEDAKKCAGMQVVEGPFGGSLGVDQGVKQASDLLLKYPDTNFIYTPEISLGMGAAQAVRQLNKPVKVVSSSFVREAIPMLKQGRLMTIVSEPGIIMGRLIVQIAIRQLDGKPMPKMDQPTGAPYPYVLVPTATITPENVDSYPFETYEIPPASFSINAVQ
jgi:ribose transport system substrate-binding protein